VQFNLTMWGYQKSRPYLAEANSPLQAGVKDLL